MGSLAFRRMAKVSASTKRSPSVSSGRRGVPVEYLTDLKVTPLDPLDPEIRQRMALDSPEEMLQSFIDGDFDIVEGDFLVVGTKEYPIKRVGEWEWLGSSFRYMALEDLKT